LRAKRKRSKRAGEGERGPGVKGLKTCPATAREAIAEDKKQNHPRRKP